MLGLNHEQIARCTDLLTNAEHCSIGFFRTLGYRDHIQLSGSTRVALLELSTHLPPDAGHIQQLILTGTDDPWVSVYTIDTSQWYNMLAQLKVYLSQKSLSPML